MIAFGVVSGLALVGAVAAAGWMQRSLWSLPLLAGVFMILYIYGKQPAWKKMIREKPAMIIPSLISTHLGQLIMVGLFYLIGFGARSLFGEAGDRAPLGMFDYQYAGVMLAAGLVLGTIVNQFTKRVYADLADLLSETRARLDDAEANLSAFTGAGTRTSAPDIILTNEPVTPASIIRGIHYSHGEYVGENRVFDGSPNEKSAGSEAKIAEAETRLKRKFPESLKAIYRLNNGGSINSVCIPNDGVSGNELAYDDVLTPFSGYNDLNPLEHLDTAWASFLAFGDPEDEETYGQFFRSGTQNMIVLAQWYRETLFLDYNQPGEPRVGFVDFEGDDWEEHVRWWPSFDAFFAALRHFEDD